jgi:hypothetical protein
MYLNDHGELVMTGLKVLVASSVMLMISAALAWCQEPAAFQAQYPNRDVLNGGQLTPAGRLGLLPNGAQPSGTHLDDGAGQNETFLRPPRIRRAGRNAIPHPRRN